MLDGWVRVEAAQRCGLARLPCIVADHLSPPEARLLRIALNRLGEKGRWDLGELKLEMTELIIEEAPIEVSGFSSVEIDQIVLVDEPDGREAGPLEPDPTAEPIAALGDLFALGPHRIACGDARDADLLARLMGADEEIRLVLTDVPYNVPIRGHVTGSRHSPSAAGKQQPEPSRARAGVSNSPIHAKPGRARSTHLRPRLPLTDRAVALESELSASCGLPCPR